MVPTETPRALSRLVLTGVGLAVFVLAYGWLLLTGTTEITRSSDPGASGISLWAAVLPPLAALVLARLVPTKREVPSPLTGLPRARLLKEAWILVGTALLLAFVAPVVRGQDLLYPLIKILFLLVVPLAAFRLIRGDGPKATAIPAPATWLAPLPAVVAWFLLSQVGPLAAPLTQKLPDPISLIVGSLITLLTASVLEEVFYRGWLQTRLEALYGRWPAIMTSSLLFALMHSSRLHADALLLGLATIVAFQGVFALMLGYLWARYRNIWVIILIHTLTNLVLVPLLVSALTGTPHP
ncbi:lysostaphin resistance A-like protein [Streptosporangium sp. CA-135522]|uniref:CPBP family intramembrane glutamic endopeptidase n=1 Tax=Streptosporangium sp. CA-135522 TaxID=3240072 RepID=UPI003D8EA3E5